MKDFINDFYSYDLTGIIHSESDFEIDIDIESTEVVEDKEQNEENVKENNDKMKFPRPETAAKPLQQESTCIIIED